MTKNLKLERVLFIALISIACFIALMTLVGLVSGRRPGDGLGAPSSLQLSVAEDEAEFDLLGEQRIKVGGGGVLIIRPVLHYAADGRSSREELVAKENELREIVQSVISGKTRDDLGPAQEGRVKAEILDSVNELLSVAQVTSVFLLEYELLD